MQDGRVEVDRNTAAPTRTLPMVNPEVEAGPTTTKSRNEDNGRRIYITKKMVSEFGATSGCMGCLEIGQPHTEECRAKITAKMDQDPAQREATRKNTTKMVMQARTTCCWKKQRPTCTGAHRKTPLSRDKSQPALVPLRSTKTTRKWDRQPVASDRWDQAATTTWSADWMCVTSSDDGFPNIMTGAPLLRDDAARARAEETAWYDKFEACEAVTNETCLSTGRKLISCR